MARMIADLPSSHCAMVSAIVAPLRRTLTARRRRSFSTTLGNRCASVFSIPTRRIKRSKCLTHMDRISNFSADVKNSNTFSWTTKSQSSISSTTSSTASFYVQGPACNNANQGGVGRAFPCMTRLEMSQRNTRSIRITFMVHSCLRRSTFTNSDPVLGRLHASLRDACNLPRLIDITYRRDG